MEVKYISASNMAYIQHYRRGVDFLYHLLTYAQGIFYNVETTDPLNSEAAKL